MTEAPGKLIGPALEKQIYTVVRKSLDEHHQLTQATQKKTRQPSRYRHHAVILDEDMDGVGFLDEPTGSLDPGKPNATICRWSVTRKTYVQTKKRLAVVNHDAEDQLADTPGAAIPIDGHYWFFGACDPMTERPEPPWKEDE